MQRSMRVEIREANVQLSEIAEQVLDHLHPLSDGPSESPPTITKRAIELYNTILRWKLTLPPRLRMEDAVLPNAILLQYVTMYKYYLLASY